ncbi:putative ABC transport system permease protein [Kineococcus xinjiangensis]|uniref:Putative ABC transport system permease protein n=1 Tax=Kineococcus xinjiangensis TaxID=512762 RepID=A0A2S6IKC4_9ACTN|nr:ABC transporter permease [Kineococcus xinjiangensis]PPK94683.1 putative ABC transport system permease protein [Kineococcus xinjiangensis]
MKGWEAFRVALDALRANRLRSLLTMLGVIIGVAAVVVVVSIGAGAREQIESQVEGLGSNLILVVPGEAGQRGAPTVSRMTLADEQLLERVVGDPAAVTARLSSGERIRAGAASAFTTVHGADADMPRVFDRPLADGSYLTATDVDTRRRVAVLGSRTAEQLFADADPVGRQVTVGGTRFRVIGVLAEQGESFGVSQDDEVHIPITTAQRILGVDRVDAFAVRAPNSEVVPAVSRQLHAALKERYPDQPFSAITQTQILGVIGNILGLLTSVLAAIAGISLLVGGVGVSNIMLVSVRERTKEIGLRKALGARQRDVLAQFLVEAVLLTTIGGVLGILIGVVGSVLLDRFSPLPAAVEWWSPVVAFAVSAAVGVFFGVFPARRAGRLDPVVALRTE